MGALAGFLQQRFAEQCPSGWTSRSEVHVLSPTFQELCGYAPRADVLLERRDGTRRLWVEFEVSRADPVANHAKFATAHLFEPQPETDAFVAMVSSHVTRGRRNLAANTILLMRHIGMTAFQTVLLPSCTPGDIKRLNHLKLHELLTAALDTRSEMERAILVSEPIAMTKEYRIHFAGDLLEVIYNVHRWNHEMSTVEGQQLWKKRTSMYFVFDPKTRLFAPAKFCAFLDASCGSQNETERARLIMTMALYTSLDESEPRFDGNRAQTHLSKNLGMRITDPDDVPEIKKDFETWTMANASFITVHRNRAKFLLLPDWFN